MGGVGRDSPTSLLFSDELWSYDGENESSANTSTNWTGSITKHHSDWSRVDPCAHAVSSHLCITYIQLTIIGLACFTVLIMILTRILFCCVRRKHKRGKRAPDIPSVEDDTVTGTRYTAISTISSTPPPRYSQIFDQDGISVFEECPPEYETSQPDLLKSLQHDPNRATSQANQSYQRGASGGKEECARRKSRSLGSQPVQQCTTNSKWSSGTPPVSILSVERLLGEAVVMEV